MIYVFDTNSFRVLGNYYPDRFPSFWEMFDELVAAGRIVSVREARNELENQSTKDHLDRWVDRNKRIFLSPSAEETEFVSRIFEVPHFRQLVSSRNLSVGKAVADPFLIAAAWSRGGCVVTEEAMKKNAAKIPNVCEHFGVDCTNVEGFMERESWTF